MIDLEGPDSDVTNDNLPLIAPVGEAYAVRPLSASTARKMGLSTGRRTRAVDTATGYTVRAITPHQPITRISDVALISSLLSAAQRQGQSVEPGRQNKPIAIETADLRRKVRAARIPNLILFVVDASGSMAARQRMTAVKGAILSLLLEAYQKRDSVGLITFRGTSASVLLPPTNSVTLAQRQLVKLPTGGRTPLADGLLQAYQLLKQQTQQENGPLPLLVLLSDGRANVGRVNDGGTKAGHEQQPMAEALTAAKQIAQRGWSSVVIDCESGYPPLGLAAKVGQALGGETIRLDSLTAGNLSQLVREKLRDRLKD
jgi:magnesium chelatase subunit D